MAIVPNPPNVIHTGGEVTLINEWVAIESLKPGYLLELHNDAGTPKWGVHDSADAAAEPIFALDQSEMNLGVDSLYAAGDLVKAGHMHQGATVWAIIPSGQNLTPGSLLQSNGDGKLKVLGSGTHIATCLEVTGAVTADTRVRVAIP